MDRITRHRLEEEQRRRAEHRRRQIAMSMIMAAMRTAAYVDDGYVAPDFVE